MSGCLVGASFEAVANALMGHFRSGNSKAPRTFPPLTPGPSRMSRRRVVGLNQDSEDEWLFSQGGVASRPRRVCPSVPSSHGSTSVKGTTATFCRTPLIFGKFRARPPIFSWTLL